MDDDREDTADAAEWADIQPWIDFERDALLVESMAVELERIQAMQNEYDRLSV